MKVIELEHAHPTVDELIRLAKKELVVLRRPDGSVFALSQVDDFDVEVELLKNNPEFLKFLKQLSKEKATITLEDLRKELGLNRKSGRSNRKKGTGRGRTGKGPEKGTFKNSPRLFRAEEQRPCRVSHWKKPRVIWP